MYTIAVKIDGIESRRRSAGLLHVLIGFFMIFHASNYYHITNYKNFWPVAFVLLVASFSLFYGFFRRKIDLLAKYNFRLRLVQFICFVFLGILMINAGTSSAYLSVFIFALLCFILLFSERRIFKEADLTLDENGVSVPGYYKDTLVKWEELSEVIVREDFVTLFHIKEKYIQFQVTQDLSTLEVAKMNAFCKEKIQQQVLNPKA